MAWVCCMSSRVKIHWIRHFKAFISARHEWREKLLAISVNVYILWLFRFFICLKTAIHIALQRCLILPLLFWQLLQLLDRTLLRIETVHIIVTWCSVTLFSTFLRDEPTMLRLPIACLRFQYASCQGSWRYPIYGYTQLTHRLIE